MVALESEDREALLRTLGQLSPVDVVKSESLTTAFANFLGRGSAEDCWQLVPSFHKSSYTLIAPSNTILENGLKGSTLQTSPIKPSHENAPRNFEFRNVSQEILPIQSPTTSCKKCKSRLEQRLLDESSANLRTFSRESNQQSSAPGDNESPLLQSSSWAYFENIVGSANQARIQRLVRAVRGLAEAEALRPESYMKLWSARGEVFEGTETDPIGRLSRLRRGREKLKKGSVEYECANRLSLLFLSNDVQQIITTRSLKLSVGVGRTTAASDYLAEKLGIPIEVLKDDLKRSKGYMQLLAQAGPGSLLEIGSEVASCWEKFLNKNDIQLVIDYRRDKLPDIQKRAESLDVLASQVILDGLLAYGWTYPEVLEIDSDLLKHIKPHLATVYPPLKQANKGDLLRKRSGDHDRSDSPKRARSLPSVSQHQTSYSTSDRSNHQVHQVSVPAHNSQARTPLPCYNSMSLNSGLKSHTNIIKTIAINEAQSHSVENPGGSDDAANFPSLIATAIEKAVAAGIDPWMDYNLSCASQLPDCYPSTVYDNIDPQAEGNFAHAPIDPWIPEYPNTATTLSDCADILFGHSHTQPVNQT